MCWSAELFCANLWLLIVSCEAKRAYLKALAYPPPILTSSSTGVKATLIPYNGTEAQSVLAAVQARAGHNVNASRSGISQHSGRSQSISTFPAHRPSFSKNDSSPQLNVSYEADAVIPRSNGNGNGHIGREPSPTLPNLPSHPTLNELINSASSSPQIEPPSFLAAATAGNAAQPRIGDPGKRMVGHALGVRHPSLTSRAMSGGTPLGIERPLAAVILND